jgi:hypothetical protein
MYIAVWIRFLTKGQSNTQSRIIIRLSKGFISFIMYIMNNTVFLSFQGTIENENCCKNTHDDIITRDHTRCIPMVSLESKRDCCKNTP